MLFALKRSAPTAVVAAVVLAGASLLAADHLALAWSLSGDVGTLAVGVGAATGLLLVDALVDRTLRWRFGGAYRAADGRIQAYFADQSPAAMAAGGVLAAAEELAFRGVVLLGLVAYLGTPPALAVVAAAALFALAHVTPGAGLRVFVGWAVWEGLALGAVFVATGSLAGVALAHAIHDAVGFAVFARRRAGAA